MTEIIPSDRLNEVFAEAAEAGVRSYLASQSPHFELVRAFALGRLEEGRALAEFFSVRKHEGELRVLDLGAGNGGASVGFANHHGHRVTALDTVVNPALRQLRLTTGLPVDQVVGTGESLPFGSATFNVVLCLDTIEHVKARRALASEILRVLKPRGFCMLTTPARVRYLFQPEPHYGIRFLAALPSSLQRFVAEKVLRRTEHYDVEYLFWHSGQLRDLFEPGDVSVLLNEDSADEPRFDEDSLYRRFFWDRILIQKAEPRDSVEGEGGQSLAHAGEGAFRSISGAADSDGNRFWLFAVISGPGTEQELAGFSNPASWQGLTTTLQKEKVLLRTSWKRNLRNLGGISYFLDQGEEFLAAVEPDVPKRSSRLWAGRVSQQSWAPEPLFAVAPRAGATLRDVTLRPEWQRQPIWWGFLEFQGRWGGSWLSEIRIPMSSEKHYEAIQLRNLRGAWVSISAGGILDFSPHVAWRASAPNLSRQEDGWELWARRGKQVTWRSVKLKASGARLKPQTMSDPSGISPPKRLSAFRLDYSALLYWVHPAGKTVHVTKLRPAPEAKTYNL